MEGFFGRDHTKYLYQLQGDEASLSSHVGSFPGTRAL